MGGREQHGRRDAVGSQRVGVRRAGTVGTALNGVDERAVLSLKRVSAGVHDRWSLAEVDPELLLGELQRDPITEQMKPDTVWPSEEAAGAERSDRPLDKPNGGGSDIRRIHVGIRGPMCPSAVAKHLVNLSNEKSGQVNDMRDLLHELPA